MKQRLYLKNELNTDFEAIAKAAELIESGEFQTDQISILPIGAKQRAYAKDISNFSFYYSDSKRKECLTIEVNQEGFYDMLPEGLFHLPPTGSAGLSEEEMVEDVQLRRAEEKDARKFFMPFEAEVNYLKTVLQLYENRLDKRTTYNDLTNIFTAEWKEFELLDREQSIIWMHFLPIIHQKRNDLKFLGQLLTVLFKIPVKVILKSTNVKEAPIDDELQFRLGSGALGINSIIGSSFLTDEEEVQINVGPAPISKLVNFMPGTAHAHLIDLAVSYLLPVETEVSTYLIADEQNKIGSLGVESDNAYLGYTVYL
ncbi:type VI secretion system baseplate subunit TssG [Pedobacter cryoconitis]|uniref:Type VI secretion system (T6SS) VasB/ImpH family protein n=1 Tax=Pedobacter cryoconitis TaxID=188932 RepID=A0A7X0J0X9_9SPHI|nr:type VI secretion system baseplate subunit TssG [Pedobacter cryoconitis]MBB6498427.1 hypothetical protein [Pedobacter cryoconitis]